MLRSAALYLERHGWIQGAYYDTTATVFTPAACLVGAIGMVCYGGPVDAPAQHFDDPGFLDFEEAVLHLDRYLLVEDGSESYEFNDAKGRRVEDVTDVLRQAAAPPAEELIDALRAIDAQNARHGRPGRSCSSPAASGATRRRMADAGARSTTRTLPGTPVRLPGAVRATCLLRRRSFQCCALRPGSRAPPGTSCVHRSHGGDGA